MISVNQEGLKTLRKGNVMSDFDFDLDLDGLDIDAAEKAVEQAKEVEANQAPLEEGDGCEGGACRI